MTILLDESVPRAIKTRLQGCTIKTVQEMGWAGMKKLRTAGAPGLTWLGAALLATYHLWVVAGLPGVGLPA